MKRYGYHRTSTREQHLDRGIKEITAYCEQNNLELEKIFTDQQTGKNFNRPRYQVLKEDVLRAGDVCIWQAGQDRADGGHQTGNASHKGQRYGGACRAGVRKAPEHERWGICRGVLEPAEEIS